MVDTTILVSSVLIFEEEVTSHQSGQPDHQYPEDLQAPDTPQFVNFLLYKGLHVAAHPLGPDVKVLTEIVVPPHCQGHQEIEVLIEGAVQVLIEDVVQVH